MLKKLADSRSGIREANMNLKAAGKIYGADLEDEIDAGQELVGTIELRGVGYRLLEIVCEL